jgi:nucleotide-binding universal stress UspA family protein
VPTTAIPDSHVLGVLIAAGFLLALGLILWWMFRVPPQLPRAAVKVRRAVNRLRTVLVPTMEALSSQRAVELAARLGEPQNARLILVYVVEVPLTLPLSAVNESQRAHGTEVLNTAQAVASRHGLQCTRHLVPARHAWDAIVRLAREEQADVIVMSVGRKAHAEVLGKTTLEILRRAPCEVILSREA